MRHGLRFLAKANLGIEIQQGGAAGHDSFEDARTTGELIRHKIAEKWKIMRSDGWVIHDDGVLPPMPTTTPPPQAPPAPSMVPLLATAMPEGALAEKRKFESVEEGADDGPLAKK